MISELTHYALIVLNGAGFVFLLSLFAIGAIGSLFFKKNDVLANLWQSFFAIIGSLWGILFSIGILITGRDISFSADSSVFPLLSFSFHIDMLSAFFIFVISLIALFCSIYGVGYIQHFYKKYSIGALGFFYHLFIVGMLMVVSASNALFFLMAWEIMSLASYFLVVYDRDDTNNVKAGFIYLVMTHIGTVFILLAFLILSIFAGSGLTPFQFVPGSVITFDFFKHSSGWLATSLQFDFESMRSVSFLIPAFFKNAVFVLLMIGFGTKAGIIPFHIWLPSAHPAAPSHVSALMSGVMIKTGIYMMIRMFFDVLQPVPLWWGVTVLIIGSVSALLGVLYALTEHDIKRLLAYHSIENIGIILLGLGSALVFSSFGNIPLALFGLAAALFHTLNHATFKSLLFLSAGSVINQTHTRNMEEYGGLIKYMPRTAFFFLI
ncbi:hydrogenase 4 subunit B, partial [Candidatus Peregrinibacteria bacterium]|nr:hydrogenase 4 subunit B [Candidatus Peregrinibacteria bacterium]